MDADNHVRRYRAHKSYYALAGMIPLKEACNLSTKASIAGMEGDLDEMLRLMYAARGKAEEYEAFIIRQIYAFEPGLDNMNVLARRKWLTDHKISDNRTRRRIGA